MAKHFLQILIRSQRPYCVSKVPPPGSNPNRARKVPWSPYDQIAFDKKSEFVEDVMEFRSGEDTPFQIRKGGMNAIQKFTETLTRRWKYKSSFKDRMRKKHLEWLVKDQLYDSERVKALGPDLAAAHFFCARGGGVKFVGKEGFVQPGVNRAHLVLPGGRDDSFKVEAINAINYDLVYEGLLLLTELSSLRWISFKGNVEFDNWCVDRLSFVAPNLEFINFSGCTRIDHNAFSCFYRFKKLRCVVVENTNQTDLFKLACLTLESEYPDLVFVGLVLHKPKKSVFN